MKFCSQCDNMLYIKINEEQKESVELLLSKLRI